MKKTYKFGEIIIALREEYQECKELLDELNRCVNIKSKYNKAYFSGRLEFENDTLGNSSRNLFLLVEKKYSKIKSKLEYLKNDWYAGFLHRALFNVENNNGLYHFEQDTDAAWLKNKMYIPEVEIINKEKFAFLVDELFKTDLMQLKENSINGTNYDIRETGFLTLNFDDATIHKPVFSHISWDGVNDSFDYHVDLYNTPSAIIDMLSMEISADKIPSDWLEMLEKHEQLLERRLIFDVDNKVKSKKGSLGISNMDNGVVKLIKKPKK